MPSASAGRGYRKHFVSTQTRVPYRNLAARDTQERPGRAFYVRIVRPLSHREPRPDSEMICNRNPVQLRRYRPNEHLSILPKKKDS